MLLRIWGWKYGGISLMAMAAVIYIYMHSLMYNIFIRDRVYRENFLIQKNNHPGVHRVQQL